jgi:hypothetical protein
MFLIILLLFLYVNIWSHLVTSGKSESQLFFKSSKIGVNKPNAIRNNLSIRISKNIHNYNNKPWCSGILIILGSFFTLVPSVISRFRQVVDSLVSIIKGSFSLGNLIIDAGKFGLAVSNISISNGQWDSQQSSCLLVGSQSLVFSESLQIQRVFNSGQQIVAKNNNSYFYYYNYIYLST